MKEPVILGKGGFGCVVTPQLECDSEPLILEPMKQTKQPENLHLNEAKKPSRYVGKLLFNEITMKEEVNAINNMKDWRVNSNLDINDYLILPEQICKLNPSKHSSVLKKCGVQTTPMDDDITQIVMKYGGIDMLEISYRLKGSKLKFNKWISLIGNLLIGVKIIYDNGFAHMDIKATNILGDNVVPNKLRLFDFSLLTPLKNVYNEDAMNLRRTLYRPYPLDIILYKLLQNYGSTDILSETDIYKAFTNDKVAVDNYTVFINYEHIKKDIKTLLKLKPDKLKSILEENVHKIDVYSLGIVFIEYDIYVDYTDVSQSMIDSYTSLVKMMTKTDPRERIDITRCIELYNILNTL